MYRCRYRYNLLPLIRTPPIEQTFSSSPNPRTRGQRTVHVIIIYYLCIYIYIYTYTYVFMYLYITIYTIIYYFMYYKCSSTTARERCCCAVGRTQRRVRRTQHMYVCMYVCIYIYRERERDTNSAHRAPPWPSKTPARNLPCCAIL